MFQTPADFADMFKRISSLHIANREFHSKDGPNVVEGPLKDVFKRHDVAHIFGAILVHRHNDLDEGQFMVEYNGTATRWSDGSIKAHPDKLFPQSWMIQGLDLAPYESSFVPGEMEKPVDVKEFQDFVQDFIEVVTSNDLARYVGLRRVPEGSQGFLEITVDGSNIMIPSDKLKPGAMDDNTTETMWFFDPSQNFRKYKCSCRDTGSSTNPNHNHIDS